MDHMCHIIRIPSFKMNKLKQMNKIVSIIVYYKLLFSYIQVMQHIDMKDKLIQIILSLMQKILQIFLSQTIVEKQKKCNGMVQQLKITKVQFKLQKPLEKKPSQSQIKVQKYKAVLYKILKLKVNLEFVNMQQIKKLLLKTVLIIIIMKKQELKCKHPIHQWKNKYQMQIQKIFIYTLLHLIQKLIGSYSILIIILKQILMLYLLLYKIYHIVKKQNMKQKKLYKLSKCPEYNFTVLMIKFLRIPLKIKQKQKLTLFQLLKMQVQPYKISMIPKILKDLITYMQIQNIVIYQKKKTSKKFQQFQNPCIHIVTLKKLKNLWQFNYKRIIDIFLLKVVSHQMQVLLQCVLVQFYSHFYLDIQLKEVIKKKNNKKKMKKMNQNNYQQLNKKKQNNNKKNKNKNNKLKIQKIEYQKYTNSFSLFLNKIIQLKLFHNIYPQ